MTTYPPPYVVLPYRGAALQLDEVVSCDGRNLIACRGVDEFDFPENTANRVSDLRFPESLLIESFLQGCAYLLAMNTEYPEPVPVAFGAARGIRVIGGAYRGDVIEHQVQMIDWIEEMATFTGTSFVDGTAILTVERATALLMPSWVMPEIGRLL